MSELERNYLLENNSSDDSSSSSEESSTGTSDDSSSSDEDDSNSFDDITELMARIEARIHPYFREIANAIEKDDAYRLNVALDNFRGNIDENLIDGETPLHYACQQSSLSCFKLLIQRGCNINSRNNLGALPLHKACALGLFNIVEVIFNYTIDKDIMIQSINRFGDTPLHEAVIGRNINIIKLLLNVGATNIGINKMIESVNTFGNTPLHQAAKYGNRKVVTLLLEFGASSETENLDRKIPCDLAKPNSEIKRILEDHGYSDEWLLVVEEYREINVDLIVWWATNDGREVNTQYNHFSF